jgi:LmbE family N-acetylglucosaminyl deacetylase
VTPSFLIDVTATYDRKREALDCHRTQFQRATDRADTRLNTPLFRQLVESRDAQFGAVGGVRWAEGVVVREPIFRSTVLKGGQ